MLHPVQYAHWHQFFENIPVSSLDFYKSLHAELAERKIPDLQVTQVAFLEGSIISSKRTYLELHRDWLTYHICVAPFGTGFFVSSRLLAWPWKSWPIIAGIAAGLMFILLLFFVFLTAINHSAGIAFIVTSFLAIPTIFFLALSVLMWFFMCRHMTYYRLDTMMAFQEAVHRVLVARINQTVEATGRKPLSAEESKPILHKLLQR